MYVLCPLLLRLSELSKEVVDGAMEKRKSLCVVSVPRHRGPPDPSRCRFAQSLSCQRWRIGSIPCMKRGQWWCAVDEIRNTAMVGALSQYDMQSETENMSREKPAQRSQRARLPPRRQVDSLQECQESRELRVSLQLLRPLKGLGKQEGESPEHGQESQLQAKLREMQDRLEAKDKEHQEVCRKLQQVQTQVEEMNNLHIQLGGTDLEKHRDLLESENGRLKQELQQLRSCKDNGNDKMLRYRVSRMEQTEVQHKAERQAEAELRVRDSIRERVEEEEKLNRLLRECQKPQIKYIIQKVEVESGKMKTALNQAQSRSRYLQEQVDMQSRMLQEMQQKLRQEQLEAADLRAQVDLYEQELHQAQVQMVQEFQSLQEEKEQAVSEAYQRTQEDMRAVHHSLEGVRMNLLTLQPALRTLTQDYNSLKKQVREFPSLLHETLREARQEFSAAVHSVRNANDELLCKYRRELQLRKECHNQLVRLRGNIRVLARVRPVTPEDGEGPGTQSVVTFDQDDDGILHVAHKGKGLSFELDKVFTPNSTQEEVFREVSPLITSCLDGYSVCILAYGQTGSGKTYSMEGTSCDPGINQRALRLLLSEVKDRSSSWEHQLSVSMIEIYNESLRDLLGSDNVTPLDIKMSPRGAGELYVPGLTQRTVQSMHDINKILELGHKHRATEQTHVNSHSSRSHALLILTTRGRETSTGICTTGKLYLVDLAGSERVSRSGAAGDRLREAQCINRSLSALGDVFSALRSHQGFVPYRNSKLTYLLQEPLSRDGKALLLLQVSPTEQSVSESLCSLRFGDRARVVELGAPARRVEQAPVSTEQNEAESPSARGIRSTSLRKKPASSVRLRIGPS
ncbi:kinesin-like protein KIFC3 [Pelodytes ibericus]